MTLGLLTITHDEPMLLPNMLDSVRGLVDGPKLAFHIGEKDETAEILRADGFEVQRRQWDNFDGSWTALFAHARGKADRFLYMQANHTLERYQPAPDMGRQPLPDLGDIPCYMIRYRRGPYEYRLPNLLRGDIAWSINAPVHGTLEPDCFHERLPLEAVAVNESDADGRRPEKLARYLPLMEKQFAENPTPRNCFYLARTYFDFGRWNDAIAMYEQRINMGGWEEEAWHAHYMKGLAQIRKGDFLNGRLTLMAAYQRRPSRAEPLYAICRSMNPPSDDLLFVEPEAYA